MNIRLASLLVLIVAALVLSGCAASDESENDQTSNTPPVAEKKVMPATAPVTTPAERPAVKEEAPPPQELPKETVKETPAPVQDSAPSKPDGKFSVQVGAYTMTEKAAQIAASAKTRFQKRVYTLHDEKTGNTKVLVGDFDSKDEARRFRDQIIQQFPEDYKGAWVYDVSKH